MAYKEPQEEKYNNKDLISLVFLQLPHLRLEDHGERH